VFCGVDWLILTDKKGKIVATELVDSSTLTKFRQRIGAAGVAEVEAIVRDQLIKEKRISLKRAIVDTTAQSKHIAYPLDTHLLHRGRQKLIDWMKQAARLGIRLPSGLRSFQRKSREVLIGLQKLGQDRMERIMATRSDITEIKKAKEEHRRLVREQAARSGAEAGSGGFNLSAMRRL